MNRLECNIHVKRVSFVVCKEFLSSCRSDIQTILTIDSPESWFLLFWYQFLYQRTRKAGISSKCLWLVLVQFSNRIRRDCRSFAASSIFYDCSSLVHLKFKLQRNLFLWVLTEKLAKELVKAALPRKIVVFEESKLPLADHVRFVSALLHVLGHYILRKVSQ